MLNTKQSLILSRNILYTILYTFSIASSRNNDVYLSIKRDALPYKSLEWYHYGKSSKHLNRQWQWYEILLQ